MSKFSVGQRVQMRRAGYVSKTAVGPFTVIGLMPGVASGHFYRIKADGEKHERVASEAHLDAEPTL